MGRLSMHRFLALVPVALSLAATALAQSCSASTPCPTTAPCCSDFGFCGSGTFCLGGCNPFASASVDACMPAPVCQSANYTFGDLSRIQTNSSAYDGDASKYDWVVDGGNVTASNGSVAMILTETNGGTRLSSTRYVHYGNITARIKAGRWAGVVTAFITMSDIKDEIDWEWPGNETTQGQSNWFWQGVVPPTGTTHGATNTGISDIYENWHDYGISWTPTALSWLVDGKVVRTVQASDNLAGGVSEYPSTPSRIELSIWPAGISTSAAGTVAWADGMIDWTDPDYVAAGNQFEAFVASVSVACGDPTAASGSVSSYVYGANTTANTPGVAFSSNTTVLSAAALSASNSTSSNSTGGGGAGAGGSAATDSQPSSAGSGGSTGLSGREIAEIAGAVVGGLALLVFAAFIVRTCFFAASKGKSASKGAGASYGFAGGAAGFGGGAQAYRPLEDPAPEAAGEAHAMRDLP